MSDFEKDDELRQKYDEVMGSIADDIRQINLDEKEPIVLNDAGDEAADSKFLESIAGIDFDDPDALLKSVGFDGGEFDDAPAKDISDFDHVINEIQGYETEEDYPDTLTCDECRDLLYDYVSDATDEVENKAVGAHLNNCEMCRIELDDIRDMLGVISSSTTPAVPSDLISGIHDRLVAIAPEVKEEYDVLRRNGLAGDGIGDRIKSAFTAAKDKTDRFVKHANWRVLAPAALSAVLVMGVAGSGIYQVMKSSDDMYSFSDDQTIANARATAKPSASGLDEYVTGDGGSTSAPKAAATAGPSSAGGSKSPMTTARPSAAAASGLNMGNSTSSGTTGSTSRSSGSSSTATNTTSGSSSSRATTSSGTSSSSSSNRTTSSSSSNRTTSSSSSNRTTASSSSARATARPTATPRPYVAPKIILPEIKPNTGSTYVTPRIILPDVASGMTSPTYVDPDSVTSDDGSGTNDTPAVASAGTGDDDNSAVASPSPTATPKPSAKPSPTPKPSPTAAPSTSATPKPSTSASPKPSSSAAPATSASAAPNLVRNDKGETEAYASKSADMEDASVISCVIESNDIYNSLMNSAFANCSKVDDEGTTLYLDGDEYVKFTEFLKENNLTYRLVILGKNNDVKVIVQRTNSQ